MYKIFVSNFGTRTGNFCVCVWGKDQTITLALVFILMDLRGMEGKTDFGGNLKPEQRRDTFIRISLLDKKGFTAFNYDNYFY